MEITKNVRTHTVLLRDWRELHITFEQYQALRFAKDDKKQNEMISIKDCDTWKIIYDWEVWWLKEFKEKDFWNAKYTVVCDYWVRHNVYDWKFDCNCIKKRWYLSTEFKFYMIRNKWKLYPNDYTESDRTEFYNLKKK